MKLSIIIPTVDRMSLRNTLMSIRNQTLETGDEILVISDGPSIFARDIWKLVGLPGKFEELPWQTGDWGASPRHRGMELAEGDYLMFIDDDDTYLDGAIATVRGVINNAQKVPHLFRMYHEHGLVLWADPEIRLANVSTQMFVVPNDKDKLGKWTEEYEGDFYFIEDTVGKYGGRVIWREEIISRWRI